MCDMVNGPQREDISALLLEGRDAAFAIATLDEKVISCHIRLCSNSMGITGFLRPPKWMEEDSLPKRLVQNPVSRSSRFAALRNSNLPGIRVTKGSVLGSTRRRSIFVIWFNTLKRKINLHLTLGSVTTGEQFDTCLILLSGQLRKIGHSAVQVALISKHDIPSAKSVKSFPRINGDFKNKLPRICSASKVQISQSRTSWGRYEKYCNSLRASVP